MVQSQYPKAKVHADNKGLMLYLSPPPYSEIATAGVDIS
jgi:hypothetical protein